MLDDALRYQTTGLNLLNTMNNTVIRILTGLVGIPLAALIIWAGGWWFASTIIVVSALALHEFYGLATARGYSPNATAGIVVGMALQTALSAASMGGFLVAISVAYLSAVGLVLFTLGFFAAEMWRKSEAPMVNAATTVGGILFIPLSLSSLIFLRQVSIDRSALPGIEGFGLVIALFVAIWAADSGAYFGGLTFGKHKLFPRVSPKKSWEGAFFGLAFAIAGGVGMTMWMMPDANWIHGLAVGAIVGVCGPLGDLTESLLKRDAAIKDSGSIIPGHGGVFDRFDSMIFAAPIVLGYYLVCATIIWSGQ